MGCDITTTIPVDGRYTCVRTAHPSSHTSYADEVTITTGHWTGQALYDAFCLEWKDCPIIAL